MPTQLFTYSFTDLDGTAGDDFLLTFDGNNTVNGGDGDDYILSDSSSVYFTGTTNSFATPFDIDSVGTVWTVDENPFFANASIPHATLYVHPDAGEMLYSSVTVGAGETITVDIDFGNGNPIGGNTDLIVTIYNSSGVQVGRNDDGSVTFLTGDEGSTHNWDSLLTFTNTGGAAEVYTIRFSEFDGNTFEGDETFVANISVTGHSVSGPTAMGDDTLNGGDGDDTIAGQGGNDSLSGGAGNDALIGGSGNDLINGGVGVDRASYADASTGVLVDLSSTSDQDTGGAGIDRLISIEQVTGSAFSDVLIGDGNNNLLAGLAGDDTLLGGAGSDQLLGGTGNDSLDGGDDGDSLQGGDGNDHLSGGAAGDVVYGEVGNDFISGGDGDDGLSGGSNDDVVFGDAGNDLLYGDSGNDQLRGGNGNDTLLGGSGNDTLEGGTGRDIANYYYDGAVSVNLSLSGDQDTIGAGTDRLSSIEDLIGSFSNGDTLTGNSGGNIIRGLGGNDVIDGGANNDVLEGGEGDDTLIGGTGQDQASYENAASAVTVDLSNLGAQNTIGAGTDTLSSIERLRGSAFDDHLTGDINGNVLWGGAGADTLDGATGNDRLFGDDGNDTLIGGDGADSLDGGLGDDTLNGGIGNDRLHDTRGTNTMDGGDGDDEITSGGGNDTLSGGIGDDLILAANGNDTLDGGDGNDHLRGSNGDDTLTGDAGNDRLVGGAGNDSLNGGANDDLLFGDAGVDVLIGGDGNDNIYGGASGDTMTGGLGADRFRLDSLVGADTITDFSVPNDTVMIDGSVFTAFVADGTLAAGLFHAGTAAGDSNDHIIYNSANGRIFYDADGTGAGAQVLIATVTPGTALTNADFAIYNASTLESPASIALESMKSAGFGAMEMHSSFAHEMLI